MKTFKTIALEAPIGVLKDAREELKRSGFTDDVVWNTTVLKWMEGLIKVLNITPDKTMTFLRTDELAETTICVTKENYTEIINLVKGAFA
jgi:hypothetical protein